MTQTTMVPDLKLAQIFLDKLEPNGRFTFQTFDDNQDRKDGRLARTLNGTLDEHSATLTEFQKKGAGVFVTINQTDLIGRKEQNVVRVRAVFVDLDGAPLEPVLEHLCEPHVIVESSKERWHAYWLSDLQKDQFRGVQKTLAKTFNGDLAICDLPRVMRLPGFLHQKSKNGQTKGPFITRIESITEDNEPYSDAQLFDHFPATNAEIDESIDSKNLGGEQFSRRELEELLAYLDPSDRRTWIAVGHAIKAMDEENLDLFIDYSEGKFWGKTPKNFVSRSDALKTWIGFKPKRSGLGALIKRAKQKGYLVPSNSTFLSTGSQVDVAKLLCSHLEENYSQPIFTEGSFWSYSKTYWQEIDSIKVRQVIQKFDGMRYGKKSKLKLSKAFIDGVINEAAAMLSRADFFADAPKGANLLNGFIRISPAGNVEILAHHPDQRQRYRIAHNYEEAQGVTYAGFLDILFSGCFGSSAEEFGSLILQIIGAAICGINTGLKAPKAFVFYGFTAANGKSTIQELIRQIVPLSTVCSIPPADLDKEQFLAQLVGKLVNLSDELSNAAAVASDKLKAAITGDPVTAKIIYREPIQFKPSALHVFSTNVLPSFKGGVDAGIERRLTVVPFTRSIPAEERIPNIATKLMEEQGSNVVSEAIREAAQVLKNGAYSLPYDCTEATQQWLKEVDPVRNWLEDGGLSRAVLLYEEKLFREIYVYFRQDMEEVGIKHIPGTNRFNAQVRAFIAEDPAWEEVRKATGKHLRRSNLVTRMTLNV